MADETCRICGARRSEHVATDKGPFTHPREAAGEGSYVMTRFGWMPDGPLGVDVPWEAWEFVESASEGKRG